MTDKSSPDLGAAMSLLLEQELMASIGLTAPQPDAVTVASPKPGEASAPDRLQGDVLRIASAALRIPEDQLDPTENLSNFGVDSIAITEVMVQMSRFFGISVSPTTFFEARHLNDLARILRERYTKAIDAHYAPKQTAPPPPAPAPTKPPADDMSRWLSRHRAARHAPAPTSASSQADAPIAVISMAGKFPQSPDIEALEAHLRQSDDCIEEVPANRWDWRAVDGDPRKGPFTNVKFGGFLAGHDQFDAAFFNISPREAELMDPQHRLFMECVWTLIERAGYAPGALSGENIGLFVGINLLDYTNMVNRAGIMDAQQMTGLGHAFCPNRLSFLLDIHGPSQVIDTACSSSLVALHRAVMSIRHEGCTMAIAGGSNLLLSPDQHIMFSQVGMLSPGGRCQTFSRHADGYARADGVGAVLLKRLDLAERDGDTILGVIRASVEHHGGGATSLTAPNPKAQARLIVEAYRQAGIDPRSVGMIECHGTGTPLGDPVEVDGLKTAFAELYRERGLAPPAAPHCGLGSIKSNIGHTETTAGIAGLVKVLLALRHGIQYRSLHCQQVNPLIDLTASPFYLLTEARDWTRPVIDGTEAPRRAGLSSFGAGGTNVHVVIEEYRPSPRPASAPGPRPLVVPVSARSDDALRQIVAALRPLAAGADLDDLAFTLQTGRDAQRTRVAFVARDGADLARQMDRFLAKDTAAIAHAVVERGRAESAVTDPTGLPPAEIAARWMAGANIDWRRLTDDTRRQRLTLPTTPFAHKRFWLPVAAPQGFALRQAGPDCWRLDLQGDEFFLTDHRLRRDPVLPGVAYLALAHAAAVRAGLSVTGLRNVVWVQPLLVTAPLTIEITLIRDGGGVARHVEIHSLSADAPRRLHAQLRLDETATPTAPTADLAALRAAHAKTFSAEQIYAAFDAMGLNYGPAHRAITHLSTGPNAQGGTQVLAHLVLPAAVAGTLDAYPLHPSLMDGAFQAAIGVALSADGTAPDGAALPFAVDGIDILGPCEASLWVHVRPAAQAEAAPRVRTLDLDVMNDAGQLRLRLRGFATRLPAADRQHNTVPDPVQFFSPHWQRPTASPIAAPALRIALLCDGVADPAALTPHLTGWTCRAVGAGPTAPLEQRFQVLAQQVLSELQAQSAPALIQLVLADGPDSQALAGLVGMLRSAALEQPALAGQVITVPPGLAPAALAAQLTTASTLPAGARLRLEDGALWQEGWEPASAAPQAAPWRDGKVYLITGGLGGLGRQLTRAISTAAPQAIIIQAGRSAQTAEAGVDYHIADLTDEAAVAALVAGIRRRHGRLDGVIHAAGVMQDAALSRKTPEQLAAVLAPKVAGAVYLDRAIGTEPLDFFVLFSSLSGAFGNPGQTDYAAANGFLDGFAAAREVRRRAGLAEGRTVSIAWPLWAEGGMTMDAATQALMTRTTGLVALKTADGLAALAAALSTDAPRLLVAAGDADKVRRRIIGEPAAQQPTPAATSFTGLTERVQAALMTAAARHLKVALDDLADDEELTEYGFDSIGFTQFTNVLNDQFGLDLTPTVFFQYPTLAGLAAHLSRAHSTALATRLGVVAVPQAPQQPAPIRPVAAPAPAIAPPPADGEAIAIIGMSGVFPQAENVEAFWRNLEQGRDCITEIPADRWDWRAIWGDPKTEAGRCNVRWGGFIDGIGQFDAGFFGLSAPEARMMDPQQRLLLTQAWRVMEDAGYAPQSLSGSSTGVFIGTADTGYGRLLAQAGAGVEGYAMTGLAPSLGPNRISFHFNLHGPSMAVETACSSALVAVHRAVEAIRASHCDTAIAGGINTLLLPDTFIGFAKAGMLSPDGHCKPFSAAADGYARGEGVGLVFLKRLSLAQRDGDRIIAVIRASGENHGGRASSLTAPNPKAQAALLRGVYARAGFDPRTLSYVEAHGTGTPLGDPIEVEALTAAFADLTRMAEATHGPAPAMRCGIGSVKSNIGHLELASGIAGLIKVLLQMRHGTLVKSLHCEPLNPYLKLADSPFQVIRDSQPWTRPLDAAGVPQPRRAGISSFGFGGANAHLVIEEYPAAPMTPTPAAGPALMVLSAHAPEALIQLARDLREALTGEASLADIAFTLQTARAALEHRLAFTAASTAEAVRTLESFIAGHDDPALRQGRVKTSRSAISVLESDAEICRAIAGLAARGRADALLELWVKGFAVAWTALYGDSQPHRVTLPGYPLATTRHWVQRAEPAAIVAHVSQPEPEPIASADPQDLSLAALTAIAARVLEVDASVLDPDAELGEFGFDSITMTGFATKVNAELFLSLTPADFFEFATLGRLARHIAASATLPARPAPKPAAPLRQAAPARLTARPLPAASENDPIAVVGFSCRFPRSLDGDAFWDNLRDGRDCITRIPADRWDWQAIDGDPKLEQGKTNIHWGGFIDGVFEFDPLFFGISPREAKLMDPQQRLLMMHVWKAIEDSGHDPRSLAGRKVGLFVGTSSSGYREIIGDDTGAEGYVATGAVPSVGPNRVSFFLDWHGPSEPVETACSSSLVALHRAVLSMRAGDCDMAVIGGVNTIVTPEAHINFAKAGMLSPDGRCKTFSANANGYVRGEGVGMVVLKRLSEAERDGDPILAIVRASAINHGGRANSLTAPNTAAQSELLRDVQARAGIDPRSIGYIEAHGTGTALGDPVEINALKAAFRAAPLGTEALSGTGCGIGSVKSNIGHLELAAGAAGIIKVLLQMRHRVLAPSLHCAEINPYIDLSDSPFRIIREAQPWQPVRDAAGQALPLRAGISSFGFGGVNAHVILEEYQAAPRVSAPHAGPVIVVLSARDEERLKDQARNLSAVIAKFDDGDLPDLAYTLQLGRDAMKHRLAVVATSSAQLRDRLTAFLTGDTGGMATGKLDAAQRTANPAVDPQAPAQTIAAAWVSGGKVDWAQLYPEPRRRLRLPTYPFARDTLHINAGVAGSAPADYAIRLDADAFYLRDHRVRGARILPGAMGLELARAAFAAGKPFAPVAITRVVWQHPLSLASGSVTATVPLTPGEKDGSSFRLLTGGAESTAHMLGQIAPLAGATAPPLDLHRLRQICTTPLGADWLYATYAGLGLDYGPAFRAVEEIFVGEGQVLARLRLPAAADASFGIHPSMLDAAFQAGLGLFQGEDEGTVALPFGLDRLEVLAPTTARMWAHLRRGVSGGGIHKLDIDLADDDGLICLRLHGFTLRVLKPSIPVSDLKPATLRFLTALVARETAIPVEEIEAEAPLEAYGIDSLMITRLTEALEKDFGPLPKTLFFEYLTLDTLAGYFLSHHAATLTGLLGGPAPLPPTPPQGGAAPRRETPPPPAANAPIAIIGMSGRYPGARDLDQFWRNLAAGQDGITEIPAERWDHARTFDPTPGTPGKTNSKWGGFIDGVDRFDPLFFNISPREAEYLDPQERLFLQTAWETLEDAGYTRANVAPATPPLAGADVGVFVGVMYEEYQFYGIERSAEGQPLALSSSAASIANRVSSFCGFHGPSLAVDSMCSSSLSAIHLACDALRAGSCRVALAGGVNLTLHPNKYLGLAQGRFLSSNGRCESFGRGGDGYVPGEGVGAVLLKPLDQAKADGDRILGVIRSSALNHGGHTNGYTVPNPAAQAAVIGKALQVAGISPRMVSYVEAHGTGTSLGDPIEIAALTKAYRAQTADTGFCAIGSVKSNIGHCESASGMAGLAKVLLQFRHRQLVPSLHSETLNPGIDFASSPFVVQRRLSEWPRPLVDGCEVPRIAGLSSFGAGGANAHLILEEYIAPAQPASTPRRDIYPLSARDPDRLIEMTRRFRQALDGLGDADMTAIAQTLQSGREAFEERLAIVAGSRAELIAGLDGAPNGPTLHRGRAGRMRGQPLIASGDLDAAAAAWVTGARIAWTTKPQKRIALPPYPFANERYWVPGAETRKPVVALPLLFAPRWRDQAATAGTAAQRRLVVLCEPPPELTPNLVAALAPAEVVVWEADASPLDARYARYAARLLDLLQTLFKDRPDAAIVQVAVPLGSVMEGLAGMLRSARQERPSVLCQLVALDYRKGDPAALLIADQASAQNDIDIRHADGRRQIRQWQELTAPAAPSPWMDNGVYLITGGAGGVGLHLCADIAKAAHGTALWLVGRSPLSADARQRLDALAASVTYRQVDVTDGAAVAALVAEIRRIHGRLTGLLHAAGLTRDSLLVRKSAEDLRAVLAPKVAGTVALDAATADLDLDMMVLFGSVSGALGNAGQADYATANAFLDSFAVHRNRLVAQGARKGRTLAIDWPYWRDGGMQLGAEVIAAMERAVGVRPLDTAPALAALSAALALRDEDQILVLDGDHERLRAALRPAQAETAPAAPTRQAAQPMTALVTACFSDVLKISVARLVPDAPLDRFGIDSILALEIVAALERQMGPLPATILFEYPSIAQLSEALAQSHAAPEVAAESEASPLPVPNGDIAVIAVAGRYPGADNVEEFWSVLERGGDCVTEVPPERWDPQYSPAKGKPGASHCKWGGFLSEVDRFDAEFFGYAPRAADLADPQERLFLETTWHLLERAGHTRARLHDHYAAKVGVFVGAMYQHYGALDTDPDSKALLLLNSYAGIANRVSFFFDLQGPSVALDSMCSSGLQAVHQACQSLRAGECRLAIAGGVNLSLHPAKYQGLSRAGLVGSHAGSRSFAEGDGYLPAEGVGAVLLKPLAEAMRDGDAVIAVIKGSAANHGGHSAGFGVPSAEAQARLIEDNLRQSGIDARSIGYVEAAANGATLGDAIELRALTRAFRAFGVTDGACAIGSVKSNMGHAEAASGLAQLTKVLLQLQHRRLAPSLKPQVANRAITFETTPFRPQWQAADWPVLVVNGVASPRRATVSSFGAGGSNVHLILEEAPSLQAMFDAQGPLRFPVSARTPGQLAELLERLSGFIRQTPDLSLARLSHTLCHGREVMDHAVEIVASSRAELLAKLAAPAATPTPSNAAEGHGPALVLPGYPFARERHWLTQPAAATPSAAVPLLDIILTVLAQELGLDAKTITPHTPFQALGLDSMISLRLGYAIEEATGIRLERRDFEDHPTPDLLAARVVGLRQTASLPAIPEPQNAPGPWRAPMTEGQKGLWVVQSLHPDSSTYNVPLAFRLSGIDHAALSRACRWLLEAFPVLSAQVVDDGTDPFLVAHAVALPLCRVAVPKGMDPLVFARQRAARPFDLGAEAPTRFELLHGGALGTDHEILLMTVHHMVFDGASAAVTAAALWNGYARFAQGDKAPPLPDQADFVQFSAWERAFIASPQGKAQYDYWRGRLDGDLPVIDLPADRPARPGDAIDGRSLDRVLEPSLAQAAKRTAAALGITPASLFLGVLTILLYRHTGQRDMLIGVPTLRRPGRRFERSVGYFVNMLALRADVSGDISADSLLRDTHRRMIEALDHGDYPFAAIARDLGRSLHGVPPYQISFAYQNFPMDAPAVLPSGTGQATFLPEIRQVGDGPFGLEMYEEGDSLRLVAGFDGARFDAATIERLLDSFARLTDAICAKPDSSVAGLEMISARDRKRLLGRWAKPPAPPRRDGLLPQWIAQQAKKSPDAIAVLAEDDSLTYRRLIRRANRLSRHLRGCGVRSGDAVAVLLGRDCDSIVALVAVLTAGAIWVPLDSEAPARRLSALLADSGAKAIITKGELADITPRPAIVIDLSRDADAIAKQASRKLKTVPAPADPAYMIYTSGSTGTAKGVVVSHQAIADHCQAVIPLYGLTAKDVVLQFAPHVVDTALEQILPTLASGGRLLLRSEAVWPPDDLRRILADHRVTVADLPPAYLREVLLAWTDAAAPPLPALRLCIVGGEALPPDTVRLWHAGPLAAVRLLNAYGPTEATITCLVHEVRNTPPGAAVPIGRPLPGTAAYVLDRDGNLVPEGVVGELHIGGSRLALGYRGRADLTRQCFIEPASGKPAARLYRTGDMASFIPGGKGLIAFHGRVDHQVKIRGFRVELGEVEAALGSFGLREAAVISRLDGHGGHGLVAYVVPASDGYDESALRAHMAARLPPHMLPSAYLRLDALPITTSGKLDRAALPDANRHGPSGDTPRDELEERLQRLWSQVLGREAASLGIHDDFHLCGGHSLLWLRLLTEIGRAFHCQPSSGDFMAAQTIAEQARVLRPKLQGGSPASQDKGLVPLRLPAAGIDPAAPLFLVHPVTGTVSCYVDLARRLSESVPVYGLQAPAAEDPTTPMAEADLSQMAARHIETLRRVQPQGPYSLAGWSLGGVVAFEMARQLRQAGEDVALLALIESYTPAVLRRFDALVDSEGRGNATPRAFARDILGLAELPSLPAGEDVIAALLASPKLAPRFKAEDAEHLRRLYALYGAHDGALMAYRPDPCDVPVTLLRADAILSDDKTCGWGMLARGGLSINTVPGDHYSVLLPPNLDNCVVILNDALAQRHQPLRSERLDKIVTGAPPPNPA
jgi:amino acid adenylation domain-containing protein